MVNRYAGAIRSACVCGVLAAAAAVAVVQPAHAQKIAYVASDAIFDRLPQAVEARATLAETQAKWSREIQGMEQQIQELRREIERNRLLWSQQERSQKEGELRDAEAKLTDYRTRKFGPNGEFEALYHELMSPVIELISVAINAEAEAQDFDFVLDKSSRGLPILFANPEYDITFAVLERLGVEIDPSELETREEKPEKLLPEELPFNIGAEANASMQFDPAKALPTNVEPVEVEQGEPMEVNPNALLEPESESAEESSDPR